jgi:hypothetical protein
MTNGCMQQICMWTIYGMDLYFIHMYYSMGVAHATKVQLQ